MSRQFPVGVLARELPVNSTALAIAALLPSEHFGAQARLVGQLRNKGRIAEPQLRARLSEDPEFGERIALAAQLGDAASQVIGMMAREPLLHYKGWAKLPKDIKTATATCPNDLGLGAVV